MSLTFRYVNQRKHTDAHTITVIDVSEGSDMTAGSMFDWVCTCLVCSGGQPNGDPWPSIQAAVDDAITDHQRHDDIILVEAVAVR